MLKIWTVASEAIMKRVLEILANVGESSSAPLMHYTFLSY